MRTTVLIKATGTTMSSTACCFTKGAVDVAAVGVSDTFEDDGVGDRRGDSTPLMLLLLTSCDDGVGDKGALWDDTYCDAAGPVGWNTRRYDVIQSEPIAVTVALSTEMLCAG